MKWNVWKMNNETWSLKPSQLLKCIELSDIASSVKFRKTAIKPT